MLRTILPLSAVAALTLAASSVQAVPLAGDVGGVSSPQITLVAGGCGIGWHRGPYGGCRRNGGPGPYWRGPGWRFYGGCWRGPAGRVHCN